MINKGGARLEDIRAAEREIIRRAASQKGIRLEREVIYITPGGEKQ
jgi:UDP-N-acetylenolpyruvoylglucosamine reductase